MGPVVRKFKKVFFRGGFTSGEVDGGPALRVQDASHALDVPDLLDVLHVLDSLEVLGPPDIKPMPEEVTYIIYI
jgi:hypothetical protein